MRSVVGVMRSSVLAAALVMSAAGTAVAQRAAAMTVILVRHAEKNVAPANDPSLTPEGQARARDLLAALRDAGVSAIITTQLARTKETAQPTAGALGLTPQVVTAQTSPAETAAAIRQHAGQTVLVVGHSNTVPAIIEALGARRPADICDAVYDNLYIVTIDAAGKASLVRAKYGARTPENETCAAMK